MPSLRGLFCNWLSGCKYEAFVLAALEEQLMMRRAVSGFCA